jgi:hypothetical protein
LYPELAERHLTTALGIGLLQLSKVAFKSAKSVLNVSDFICSDSPLVRRMSHTSPLRAANTYGLALLIDGDVCKQPFGHAVAVLTRFSQHGLHPDFQLNGQRSIADPRTFPVTADDMPDFHRPVKSHAVYRDRDYTPDGDFFRQDPSADIHLLHDPAAKDVAIGIRVSRHCHRSQQQIAIWL